MLVTTPEAHVQHRYSEDHERGGAEQEHLPARAPASSSTAHHRGHVHASLARALSLSLSNTGFTRRRESSGSCATPPSSSAQPPSLTPRYLLSLSL
ncbi:hypothetical protein PGIGA_G00194960, partial [Pangasianodon gigas]|nr:hypothetical protein [Pangasianodon gigas]